MQESVPKLHAPTFTLNSHPLAIIPHFTSCPLWRRHPSSHWSDPCCLWLAQVQGLPEQEPKDFQFQGSLKNAPEEVQHQTTRTSTTSLAANRPTWSSTYHQGITHHQQQGRGEENTAVLDCYKQASKEKGVVYSCRGKVVMLDGAGWRKKPNTKLATALHSLLPEWDDWQANHLRQKDQRKRKILREGGAKY